MSSVRTLLALQTEGESLAARCLAGAWDGAIAAEHSSVASASTASGVTTVCDASVMSVSHVSLASSMLCLQDHEVTASVSLLTEPSALSADGLFQKSQAISGAAERATGSTAWLDSSEGSTRDLTGPILDSNRDLFVPEDTPECSDMSAGAVSARAWVTEASALSSFRSTGCVPGPASNPLNPIAVAQWHREAVGLSIAVVDMLAETRRCSSVALELEHQMRQAEYEVGLCPSTGGGSCQRHLDSSRDPPSSKAASRPGPAAASHGRTRARAHSSIQKFGVAGLLKQPRAPQQTQSVCSLAIEAAKSSIRNSSSQH